MAALICAALMAALICGCPSGSTCNLFHKQNWLDDHKPTRWRRLPQRPRVCSDCLSRQNRRRVGEFFEASKLAIR
jgi:hypothetical protein